jgi:hypothetical protein
MRAIRGIRRVKDNRGTCGRLAIDEHTPCDRHENLIRSIASSEYR